MRIACGIKQARRESSGVWVLAYEFGCSGGRMRRYDVFTGRAAWLGCEEQHVERVLQGTCELSPEDALVYRLRADQRLQERSAGCPRRRA